jgi:tetratricopeptide (TPR) repeat protein
MLHAALLATALATSASAAPTPAAAPAPASAEEASRLKQARELFTSALALYKQGRFAEALTKFEATWVLRPHPSIQFNLGKCFEELGDSSKALRAYREYLRLAPEASDRDVVAESIARLERSLRAKGLQQLSVSSEPAGAHVTVDGADLGPSPATATLPVGVHRVVVSAEGFAPYEKAVLLQLLEAASLEVKLEPARPVADAPVLAAPPVLQPVVTQPEPTGLAATVEPQPKTRVWTWVAGGVAVAAAGVAGGLLGGSYASAGQLAQPNPARTPAEANRLYDGGKAMGVGSQVAWGVAGAAAVTAIILFIAQK